jgi:hypothetical protein
MLRAMRGTIAITFMACVACSGGTKAPLDPHPTDYHPVGAAAILRGTVQVQAAGFCGGAFIPNREIPKPAPAANARVTVRVGDTNSDASPVATLTTKADGTFETGLTEGTFCLVLDDKRDRPKASQYTDQSCLDAYFKQCDAVAHLPSSTPTDILHSNTCFGPCYHGPLPP